MSRSGKGGTYGRHGSSWSISVWDSLLGTALLIATGKVLFKCAGIRITTNDATVLPLINPYLIVAFAAYVVAMTSRPVVRRCSFWPFFQ